MGANEISALERTLAVQFICSLSRTRFEILMMPTLSIHDRIQPTFDILHPHPRQQLPNTLNTIPIKTISF
jgi:hypothetical protein